MTATLNRPIAITLGDPAGIGPEVVLKALRSDRLGGCGDLLAVGDARVLTSLAARLGLAAEVVALDDAALADQHWARPGRVIRVLDLGNADPALFPLGRASALAGRAAMEAIAAATTLTLSGRAAALVTAPINKEATQLAGFHDVGHLEYLARVTGSTEYATMLVTGRLRVVHLTTHYSLREACDRVTQARILGKVRLTHASFASFGFARPRIGVAALNPHGSEGGMFGREELDEIAPAVAAARAEGIDARGPYPADSIFNRAMAGDLDVILAMYHDQGHIPIKVHGFEESVSVALGLPLVRTSVDHGTAFDIAGQGKADATSMIAAIEVARQIVTGAWVG